MSTMNVWTASRPPAAPQSFDQDQRVPGPARDAVPVADAAPSRHRVRRVCAATGLLAGVAVTVAFAAMALLPMFGMRTMIVLSGSMVPAFQAGDAVVVEHTDPDRVQVGDMIAFTGYGTEQLTTHRVISLHEVKGELHFRTQGDANPDPDANLAPAAGLHGRVRLVLPHAGRVLAMMTGQRGKLLILGMPAAVLTVGQVRTLLASARASSAGMYRPGVMAAGVAVLAVAAVTGATLVHTMATFTGAHAAGGNSFTTGTGFGAN